MILPIRVVANPHSPPPNHPDPYLLWSVKDVETVVRIKRLTILQMAENGEFPKPLIILREKTGKPRKYAWRANEVREWIEARANER